MLQWPQAKKFSAYNSFDFIFVLPTRNRILATASVWNPIRYNDNLNLIASDAIRHRDKTNDVEMRTTFKMGSHQLKQKFSSQSSQPIGWLNGSLYDYQGKKPNATLAFGDLLQFSNVGNS